MISANNGDGYGNGYGNGNGYGYGNGNGYGYGNGYGDGDHVIATGEDLREILLHLAVTMGGKP